MEINLKVYCQVNHKPHDLNLWWTGPMDTTTIDQHVEMKMKAQDFLTNTSTEIKESKTNH